MRNLYARFVLFLIRPALEIEQKTYQVRCQVNKTPAQIACGKCSCQKMGEGLFCIQTGMFVPKD